MPRFNEIINNFINGEVSPRMYGRSDSDVYKRSCRKIENMIVYPQGGASRRSGTELVLKSIKNTDMNSFNLTKASRVIDFIYSREESYKVIFHGNASFGANYFMYIINVQDGAAFVPYFSGGVTAGFAYDSVGAGAVSANTLTDEETIFSMQYAQSGNTMYFAHPDFPPFLLQRIAKNRFYLSDFYRPYSTTVLAPTADTEAIWRAWPFMDLNLTATTMAIDTATVGTGRTLTSSTSYFTADMVGTPIFSTNSGTVGICFIDVINSATSAEVSVVRAFPGTSAYTTWGASAWSKTKGYPKTVSFAEGRVLWASTKSEPEKIWFSQSGDIFELSNANTLNPGATKVSSDPGSFVPASEEANEVLWLKGSGRATLCGTRGREYSFTDFDGTGLPPAQVRAHTSSGSENVQPVTLDDSPIYVQRGFRKRREMLYDYRVEGYTSPDLTFLAEHMPRYSQRELPNTSPRIRQMAYQALDNNLLWVVDDNGYLFSCTRSRENVTTAFHRHELGGSYDGGHPFVQSISAGPNKNGTSDELWMIVRRTVDSAEQITLERMAGEFYGTTLHHDLDKRENTPVFSDMSKIFRPASPTFWARLNVDEDATFAVDDGTGTITGTITFAEGEASIDANSSYITWPGLAHVDTDAGRTGCVRFTVSNNAVQTSGALQTLLCISQDAGSTDGLLKLSIQGTSGATFGDIVLQVLDSSGSNIINSVTLGNMGTVSSDFPSMYDVVFELNFDFLAGETRLFVNGKQLGATQTGTGNRGTDLGLFRLNANQAGAESRSGYSYKDVVVFGSVQHTEDHDVFDFIPSSTTVVKLEEFEGETVAVLGDGNYIGDYEVTGGEITLPATYDTIIVGLKYRHVLQIQPVDLGTGIGSATGSIKRIDRAMVRFNNSAAASVGRDEDNLEELVFRVSSTPMGDPIELVTDDKIIDLNGDYDRQASIVVAGDDPLPCNVTCISLRGVTADV